MQKQIYQMPHSLFEKCPAKKVKKSKKIIDTPLLPNDFRVEHEHAHN